jgi:Ca-activated chloride channel family protein
MTWEHPVLLALIPALAALVVALDRARSARLRRLLAALGGAPPGGRERARTALVGAAVCSVALALAGPRPAAAGRDAPPIDAPAAEGFEEDGWDVVLALDMSRSMTAADVPPDRMALARRAALRIVAEPGPGKIGVVAFASEAYQLVPPTSDRGLALLHLEQLDPGAVSAQGSDLGQGLSKALDSFGPDGAAPARRAVVVVSDGEGFEDDGTVAAALTRARESGVAVHTVAVGTPEGAAVPGAGAGSVTHARPEVLARMAGSTGGRAVRASDQPALAALARDLAASGGDAHPLSRMPPPGSSVWESWLALLALALLMTETAADMRTRGRAV